MGRKKITRQPPLPPEPGPLRTADAEAYGAHLTEGLTCPSDGRSQEELAYSQDQARLSITESVRFLQTMQELMNRANEALNLYRPLPIQDEFHRSMASERILRGGNRSGKTCSAMVELARCATGQDPYNKYPKENAIIFVIGYDHNHIGRVIYPYLFKPGAFKIIKDLRSGHWRSFRPWEREDRLREAEAKPSPPLIPPRFIAKFAYETKAKDIFQRVLLTNGTVIFGLSSKGNPPQGNPCDLYLIDEDLEREDFIDEAQARLPDRKGRLVWSALPHSKNLALATLSERAAEEAGNPNPDIEEFVLTFSGNPHIDPDEKRKQLKRWDEETQATRDRGEFSINNWIVYDSFDWKMHGLLLPGGVPDNWTRYVIVDPGRQVCAVSFFTCPPPTVGDFVCLYKELYLKRCTADLFGKSMAQESTGEDYEAFIIDTSGSRIQEIGTGVSIEHQYSDALRRHKVKCRRTGHQFLHSVAEAGSVMAGVEAFRDYLRVRQDGTPRFRARMGEPNPAQYLPNFYYEIRHYHHRRIRDVESGGHRILDEPDERKNSHIMACLRYCALFRPRYVPYKREQKIDDSVYRAFQRDKEKKRQKAGENYINLGPPENVQQVAW